MDSPSLPLTLSRSVGRSFRHSSKASPTLLFPKSLSASSSYTSSRRTSSGRYLPLSKDELCDSSASFSEMNYTIHMPGSPEQKTILAAQHNDDIDSINTASIVDADISMSAEQQVLADTMFTGGYNSSTKGRILHKRLLGDDISHPQLAHTSDLICSVDGCDGKVMYDAHGAESCPCECKYPICNDCYIDAFKDGGICPGCREVYKPTDEGGGPTLSLPASIEPQMERALSLVRSTRSQMLMSTKNFDFDYAHWLYETKGTYGYGNALKSRACFHGGEENLGHMCEGLKDRMSRPLVRENKLNSAIISPYRVMVFIRIVSLFFFLAWRIRNPNREAMWLWGLSVVCEVWFAFSWILDQIPKLMPINRFTNLEALKETFERPSPGNPEGRSDLPGIDFFVSTADPDREPPLITANSVLSILAVDYPVEKVACYLSDDSGALHMFEALAEAASYARLWVPFCRKHGIEPRNPESYFNTKGDATKNKTRNDFVKDRRRVKREYDEFKVRINSLPDIIRRRSDACNACEETKAKRAQLERRADLLEKLDVPRATWMADGNHWPGTWATPVKEHHQGDHAGIIQVMLKPPNAEPLVGRSENDSLLDLTDVDIRLPMLVYVSREKRPGYDHNKKAGAMNALLRASAIMSNAPFVLNLDCDHYIYNSQAVREGMCFMLGAGGANVCFVQFPQRFDGVDPNDRYANHNTVFFDGNMRALDGVQGPMYVGTGCIFRRTALYGFNPPEAQGSCVGCFCCCDGPSSGIIDEVDSEIMDLQALIPKNFGGSEMLLASIPIAELHGRPLAVGAHYGRPAGLLTAELNMLRPTMVAEAVSAISCWYEDKTEWGSSIGWIYGSVTEDIATGYRMHNRGWQSVYCIMKRDAFRGTAPINLTDRLYQVLRWATGSIEIFFSYNNGLLAGPQMKLLQRIAYVNIGIYPFTSLFLLVYCFLPALSLFSNQFIVQQVDAIFLIYLLVIAGTLCCLAILEVRWSGITLEEWWRNEQFWVVRGTSAHLAAVVQGLLKLVAGIDISFSLTSKSSNEESRDEFGDLYVIKWTSLMIPPLTIMLVNLIAIAVAVARSLYSPKPDWNKLLGGTFFSMWVLLHLYPFAKGFMGRRGRTPTIVWVWAGLLATIISLLWVAISSPSSTISTRFQL